MSEELSNDKILDDLIFEISRLEEKVKTFSSPGWRFAQEDIVAELGKIFDDLINETDSVKIMRLQEKYKSFKFLLGIGQNCDSELQGLRARLSDMKKEIEDRKEFGLDE